MPQPITHYLVIKNAMKNTQSNKWEENNKYAGFGSFGPDLFYMKDIFWGVLGGISETIEKYNYEFISDLFHWEGSLDFFSSMLDNIKKKKNEGASEKVINKLLAFAYGYYCHAVSDFVFHPFVYRKSEDHWLKHDPAENYNKHKLVEAVIDTHLLKKIEGKDVNPYKYKYYEKIKCYHQNNDKTLDEDIFKLINDSIKEVYAAHIDSGSYNNNRKYAEYFEKFSLDDEEHPIHEAYDDFVDTISSVYSSPLFNLTTSKKILALKPIKSIVSMETEKYLNEKNSNWSVSEEHQLLYSAEQLFNIAVSVTEKIILASEAYLNDVKSNSAKDYFHKNHADVPYLDKNYNLDTGLPCDHNDNDEHAHMDEKTRFLYAIEELNDHYKKLESVVV